MRSTRCETLYLQIIIRRMLLSVPRNSSGFGRRDVFPDGLEHTRTRARAIPRIQKHDVNPGVRSHSEGKRDGFVWRCLAAYTAGRSTYRVQINATSDQNLKQVMKYLNISSLA
jgi:hypothetical protein